MNIMNINYFHSLQQAKDLQLALILVCVVCMFFVTNLPRLLLNLYELFNVDEMIACKEAFFPPTWFICSTSINHLLLVLNCVMNFVVYCCFNDGFKNLLCGRQPPSIAAMEAEDALDRRQSRITNVPLIHIHAGTMLSKRINLIQLISV
jgi:hypothetical protein